MKLIFNELDIEEKNFKKKKEKKKAHRVWWVNSPNP